MKNYSHFLIAMAFVATGLMQCNQASVDVETVFEEFKPNIADLRKKYDMLSTQDEDILKTTRLFNHVISSVEALARSYTSAYLQWRANSAHTIESPHAQQYVAIPSTIDKGLSEKFAYFRYLLEDILEKYFTTKQEIEIEGQKEIQQVITPEGEKFIEYVINALQAAGFPKTPHQYSPEEFLQLALKNIQYEIKELKNVHDMIVNSGGIAAFKEQEAINQLIPYLQLSFKQFTPEYWQEFIAWEKDKEHAPQPTLWKQLETYERTLHNSSASNIIRKIGNAYVSIYFQPPFTYSVGNPKKPDQILLTPEGKQFTERIIELLKEAGFSEKAVAEKSKKELADMIFVDFKKDFDQHKSILSKENDQFYPIIKELEKYLLIPTIKLELQHYSNRAIQEELAQYYNNNQRGKKPNAFVEKETVEFNYGDLVSNLIKKLKMFLFKKETLNSANGEITIYYGQTSEIENLTKQIIEFLKTEGFSEEETTLPEVVEKIVTPEIEKDVATFIATYQKDAATLTAEQKEALHALVEYLVWQNNINQEQYTEQDFNKAYATEDTFIKTLSLYPQAKQFQEKIIDLIMGLYTTKERSAHHYRKLRPQGHQLLEKIIAQLKAAGIE